MDAGAGNRPSEQDWQHFESRLADGVDPARAARERGLTSRTFRRSDCERHHVALQEWRGWRRSTANERGEAWAVEDGADPRLRIAYLKAESEDYRQGDSSQVEITGGSRVEVDLDFGRIL